tara:strand:+ start:115 stop:921 length:807 start_codon:yes stop_codon:yes gene_type:complete
MSAGAADGSLGNDFAREFARIIGRAIATEYLNNYESDTFGKDKGAKEALEEIKKMTKEEKDEIFWQKVRMINMIHFSFFLPARLRQEARTPFNLVECLPSSKHGFGVFAKAKISKGVCVTLYPCHACRLNPTGIAPGNEKNIPQMFLHSVDETPQPWLGSLEEFEAEFSDYGYEVDDYLQIYGDKNERGSTEYLGHMINDVCKPVPLEKRCYKSDGIYVELSKLGRNCKFSLLPNYSETTLVAILATREIEAGEELLIPYGLQYWYAR